MFTAGNAFLLGLVSERAAVGYYSAAEKVMFALSGVLSPISLGFFPRLSFLAENGKAALLREARKMFKVMLVLGSLLSLCLFCGAGFITHVLLGAKYQRSVDVMRILSPFIFINAVTNVFGIQIMLPFGCDRPFFRILLAAGVANVVLGVALAPLWQENGMALAVLSSGIIVTMGQVWYLYKRDWLPFGKVVLEGND